MSIIRNSLLMTPEGYQISRSVRLRSSASAYFARTPSAASNQQKWTWSAWVKRGALPSGYGELFGARTGSSGTYALFWFYNDTLTFQTSATSNITTSAVYRDPSAWYHIVLSVDTTQATASNRTLLYVNGVQVTAFSTATYPAQNATLNVNSTANHFIGQQNSSEYFDGYLTEVNFIDGQALTPSSFGETDAITGVWKPKKYAGTYGTNGFYLNFSDNSAATAAAIGKDNSGNGNNWTPNNISVTAGVTYDSMIDTPTLWGDGGNGRGNYCVLNPLQKGTNASASNGNLSYSCGTNSTLVSSFGLTSGKWYWEIQNPTAKSLIGIINSAATLNTYIGLNANGWGYYGTNGQKYNNGGSAYGATFTTTDVIGVAFDADNGTLTFYKNNTSQGTAFTGLTSGPYFPAVSDDTTGGATGEINFGQRPFSYTPPTGFKALNTQNLPEPTIVRGNRFMDATTYTGTGAARSVTNAGSFQPDLVWIKDRGNVVSHILTDSARGTNVWLRSNTADPEVSDTTALTAFNSGGFSLGTGASSGAVNNNGNNYIAWQWREGATQGFDIVTYAGNGTSQNIAHSLGVAPRMMIIKNRGGTVNWGIYHASLGSGSPQNFILQFDTSAQFGPSSTYWNGTAPTSSVFSVGSLGNVNGSGGNFVAYLFAEVAGFSKFGSYVGNGSSTDGPFVFCGFRPRWVMVKRTDSAGYSWYVYDTARDTFNQMTSPLYPNLSNAESVTTIYIDTLSNGFKLRTTSADTNASGGTYIFVAFAENPFKNSLAR